MPLIRPQTLITAIVIFFTGIIVAGNAAAQNLTPVTIAASSLIPGQEARYTIKFRTETELNLSNGASVAVELPPGFQIVQNDIMSTDPGCTLARIEYKNPGDRFYAVVHGTASVKKAKDSVQCNFIPQVEQLVIPANTDLYLIIPGIVNPPATGRHLLKLFIRDARGGDYYGTGDFSLGLPPAAVVQNVRLVEAASSKVQLAWNPAPGATRYRVVFSSQPAGQFISALDFGREPSPGEEWRLTETTHSFTGRGNGGLSPGRTYYFKVLAGNDAGFGPGSEVLRVTLPEIKLLHSQPRNKAGAPVLIGDPISAVLDQPVKIINEDGIRVYEQASGVRVRQVRAAVDEIHNNVIRINAELQPGKTYRVIIYEGALGSQVQQGVFNNTFSWMIAVAGKQKGV